MKISEYLQLDEALKANGTSVAKEFGLSTTPIDEAEVISKPELSYTDLIELFEAEISTLDTDKTTWKNALNPFAKSNLVTRWGRMKTKLNSVGKNMQKDITEKVINKYLPSVLASDRQTFEAVAQAAKEGKDINGIRQILKAKQAQTAAIQQKSLNTIYSAIEQFLSNSSQRMDKKIESSKMSNKNKVNVKNYWLLLQTQIKLNAYNYISQTMTEDAEKLLGTTPEILKAVKDSDIFLQDLAKKSQQEQQKEKQTKASLVSIDKDMEAEEPAQAQSAPTTAEVVPEVGKKYTYTNAAKKSYEITVTKINPDGSLQTKISTGGTALIPANKVATLVPVAETPAAPTATAPAENPAENPNALK